MINHCDIVYAHFDLFFALCMGDDPENFLICCFCVMRRRDLQLITDLFLLIFLIQINDWGMVMVPFK